MNNIDLLWLAINAYHEARGEKYPGMIAVCHVVLNRAIRRKMTVKEIILQKMQFSWTNYKPFPHIGDYEGLEKCVIAAGQCIEDRSVGITLGDADHYFADYIEPPKWTKNMEYICKIGKHLFFKS